MPLPRPKSLFWLTFLGLLLLFPALANGTNSTLEDEEVFSPGYDESYADRRLDPLEFQRCVRRAKVVSEVFCLPEDYRKDVPPASESKI